MSIVTIAPKNLVLSRQAIILKSSQKVFKKVRIKSNKNEISNPVRKKNQLINYS